MRIDKKRFPSFIKIIESRKFATHFDKVPEFEENIQRNLSEAINEALERVEYITHPIIEAVDYCSVDTVKKLLTLRTELESFTKVFLYVGDGGSQAKSTYETQFVKFEKQDDKTAFFVFGYTDVIKTSISYFILGYFNHSDPYNVYQIGNFSYIFPVGAVSQAEVSKFLQYKIDLAIQFEVFLQYAETETKYLKPHHKDIDGVACKYVNKLPIPISIIDSTWFTNLVKSDAFKVRGHFRLQPFGHGMKNRKLIWISEFQKTGYKRDAKILSEHPTKAGIL